MFTCSCVICSMLIIWDISLWTWVMDQTVLFDLFESSSRWVSVWIPCRWWWSGHAGLQTWRKLRLEVLWWATLLLELPSTETPAQPSFWSFCPTCWLLSGRHDTVPLISPFHTKTLCLPGFPILGTKALFFLSGTVRFVSAHSYLRFDCQKLGRVPK